MDRSLKLRTLLLVTGTLLCIGLLIPSFASKETVRTLQSLPWPVNKIFKSKMSLGLDLQGGLHLVYSIDLDKAIDDRASELKRDLESRLSDEKLKGAVKTPAMPLGAVTVLLDDASKREQVRGWISKDYGGARGDEITYLDCPATEPKGAICFRVSSTYGDSLKKAALSNAVATIRER